MNQSPEVIHKTENVCPVCLNKIPARHVLVGGDIFLQKTCDKHGDFSSVIWRGASKPDYHSWEKALSPLMKTHHQINSISEFKLNKQSCPNHKGKWRYRFGNSSGAIAKKLQVNKIGTKLE